MAAAASTFSPLSRALVQQGKLVQADANALHAEAKKSNVTFIEQLVASKKMGARDIAHFAAGMFGVPLLDLSSVDPEQLPTSAVDSRLVASKRVIPLLKRGNRLFLGMSDPTSEQLLSELKFATGSVVEPVVVEEDKLATLIKRFGESSAKTLDTMIGDDTALGDIDLGAGDEAQVDTGAGAPEEVDDAPVVKYVQKVLIDAINGGASDIHFEPYEKFYRIRYRTDGILADVAQPPLAIKEKIASRIKVISKLDISEKRVP
ncbi:MAG: Flp pilus assembly complex ATPase component TadA, partial [Betaproteobacteria bacterium]|nr:Flp pilus assembly complex ATPase component TadA [Betaproteobacteria bacterium]